VGSVEGNFSSKENFLTEAFAYFLQTDKAVCEAFVGRVIGSRVQIEPDYNVETRAASRGLSAGYGKALTFCFSFLRLAHVSFTALDFGPIYSGKTTFPSAFKTFSRKS